MHYHLIAGAPPSEMYQRPVLGDIGHLLIPNNATLPRNAQLISKPNANRQQPSELCPTAHYSRAIGQNLAQGEQTIRHHG